MNFASTRIITADVARVVAFYEEVTGATAEWGNDVFAEIVTPAATLAIAGEQTMALFDGLATAGDNHSLFIEFQVDDVDAEHARLAGSVDVAQEPRTMPWGNRSLVLRDPDGNLVNLYTPVTDEALARFAAREVPAR